MRRKNDKFMGVRVGREFGSLLKSLQIETEKRAGRKISMTEFTDDYLLKKIEKITREMEDGFI